MVIVVTQGIVPENQPIRATCGHCKTVIEFLPEEATYTSDHRDGDFYTIPCPVCEKIITKNVVSYNGPGLGS